MVKGIAYVAYPSNDVAATRAWYERILGLTFAGPYIEGGVEKYNEAHFPDGCFSLMASEWIGREAGSAASVYFEVDDIEDALRTVRSHGVVAEDIWDGPVCRQTSFCDPEGNKVVLQPKETGLMFAGGPGRMGSSSSLDPAGPPPLA